MKEVFKDFWFLFVALFISVAMLFAVLFHRNNEMDEFMHHRKNYTVYLNGNEIDAETVDLSEFQYNEWSLDDENMVLYLR